MFCNRILHISCLYAQALCLRERLGLRANLSVVSHELRANVSEIREGNFRIIIRV